MTHLPLAFSIHHFISSVGADAGFASIIGLAILVLLYFAQARETATLRERADGAEQRAAQLEARLSQVAQAARAPAQAQPVVPRPVPSPIARPLANPIPAASPAAAATAGAGAPAAPVAMPSAPAGVGAPALTSATRLISLPAGGAPAPAQPQAVPVAAETDKSPEPVAASGPAPATAAGASASATALATALATPPIPVETGNGSGGDTSSQPLLDDEHEPRRRVQLRPGGGGARQMPPLRQPPSSRGPSRFGRVLAALLGVLGVAAVIAVLLIVTGGGSKNKPSGGTSTSNAPAAGHKSKTKGFNKRAVTVTVLNGTGTAGLAAHILSQLTNAGFKQGTATNAANATQTTSIVAYLPGQKAAAQQVAKTLKLGSGTVSQIDPNTESIACPQATCNVDVVVTVGQDLVGR
jgi:hypothetical protein